MKIAQLQVGAHAPDAASLATLAAIDPHVVLVFGSCRHFQDPPFHEGLADALPGARRVGCTTAGEISSDGVSNDTAVLTALHFDNPSFRVASAPHTGMADSARTGRLLGESLRCDGLHSIIVFGLGVDINGTELIGGIRDAVGTDIAITGGLAGDGGAFRETWTLLDDQVSSRHVVGIGFHGTGIRLAYGCFGGWEPFGAPRKITRAAGNILYELDGEPALDLYKKYLGEYAADLPASGLLYPFEMLDERRSEVGLIRTILGIDNEARSLTLAGNLVENGYLRLMHASADSLVDGAEEAAKAAKQMTKDTAPGLALLVSCVGRKLVMGGRVDEEVEAVADVYGTGATITGFYSYGEISPFIASPECKLHNQTMAITYLNEAA